jgi:hypothetical protein
LDDGSTWVINSPNASLFGSIVNIGAMTGSLLGGVLLDKLGRQRTICLAGIPFTLAWYVLRVRGRRMHGDGGGGGDGGGDDDGELMRGGSYLVVVAVA